MVKLVFVRRAKKHLKLKILLSKFVPWDLEATRTWDLEATRTDLEATRTDLEAGRNDKNRIALDSISISQYDCMMIFLPLQMLKCVILLSYVLWGCIYILERPNVATA